jgi:phosphate transport system permease protein
LTAIPPSTTPAPAPGAAVRRRRRPWGDLALAVLSRGSAVGVILMLLALVGVLTWSAIPSFRTFGPGFLVSSQWRPNELQRPKLDPAGKVVIEDGEVVMEAVPPAFGALPVIYGTVVSSILALVLAVPLSLGTALFIVRVAPLLRIAPLVSFLVEFLAAVPSIAFGMWGLFQMVPWLQGTVEPAIKSALSRIPGLAWMFQTTVQSGTAAVAREIPLTGKDMLAGGMILAIMILPIVTAVSRDVLKAVPRTQLEGTLALGATWWQSSWSMLRFAKSGLFGAVMLGLARAAGETMAITMVIGNNNQVAPSPFAPAQTMSSLLANEFAEASTALHRAALLEVALILLAMSLLINIVARWFVVGRNRSTGGHG